MAPDDLRRLVERVGGQFDFGEYELEAYLAVLEEGELAVSGLAERTAVPKTRIYDVVRDLEGRGVVELRESRPMTVVAVDPEEAFADVRSSLDDLLEELESRFVEPTWDVEAVSLVRSRTSLVRYLEAAIEAADFELALALTPPLLERFADDLRAARGRGVTVNLLVFPAADAPDPDEFDYRGVASMVRARRGVTSPVVAVADGQFSMYATREAFTEGDRYGVIFDESVLGFLVYGFYSTLLWTTADPVVDPDVPATFPRQYAAIRQCIRDVRATDGELRVSIEGRDVLTGGRRTVEGRISGTRLDENLGIANLAVTTETGEVTVGGRVAALEDVEAHCLVVEHAGP